LKIEIWKFIKKSEREIYINAKIIYIRAIR